MTLTPKDYLARATVHLEAAENAEKINDRHVFATMGAAYAGIGLLSALVDGVSLVGKLLPPDVAEFLRELP